MPSTGATPPLATGWELTCLEPDSAACPSDLSSLLAWTPAPVPGTAAAALEAAGLWQRDQPQPLHDRDVWYRGRIELDGQYRLRFGGLATIAEVWLDGGCILRSENMFAVAECDADLVPGRPIHLCFRSLHRSLSRRKGRARWRPRLAAPPALRFARTTLFGQMPGWCPNVHAVGPWRPIEAFALGGPAKLSSVRLRPTLEEEAGRLSVRLGFSNERLSGAPALLRVEGREAALTWTSPTSLEGELRIHQVEPWWPHTHGAPRLYSATSDVGGSGYELGSVGFRRLELDRGADGKGFALRINDVPVFCRGASWTSADLVRLPDDAASFERWLRLAREAGINMLRVPGITLYESDAFYTLCDQLGILVWQDFAFANFDYPAGDPAFMASAVAEAEQFLERTVGHASIAVLCGGSEIDQQAAMLGLAPDARANPLFDAVLPEAARRLRPELPYVPHTPCGSPLPFLPGSGVSHYYGVGAYLRPLEDARRAGVRFASECLAFANVPDSWTVSRALGVAQTHDPRWKAAVPRDVGASWDFEDVRDHYLRVLFGQDPLRLRYEEPERYLELSRAVSAILVGSVFSEWRRPGSGCGGGLIWQFQDLRPGAGWGIVDSLGRPKSAWHALKQVSKPVQLLLTDEGLNGLGLHVVNETSLNLAGRLRLACISDGRKPVITGEREIGVPARGGCSIGSADLLPSFFDVTYAYRFGPPAHDVVIATLSEPGGKVLDEAFYFPSGWQLARRELQMAAVVQRSADSWQLRITSDRVAQFVYLEDVNFRGQTEWFHLAPGREYLIGLAATGREDAVPEGDILALNSVRSHHYSGAATGIAR